MTDERIEALMNQFGWAKVSDARDLVKAAFAAGFDEGRQEERERAAAKVPTNWLDPLLTGPEAVIGQPPYHCADIEALLRAIKAAVLAQPEQKR